MGGGSFTTSSYSAYTKSVGHTYNFSTGRVEGHKYKSTSLDESLDPTKFTLRECVNSEEHPNTVPVILALDVTGSMGDACSETAAALGKIITTLYEKYKDIEFCVMGIGDIECDHAPIQMSQFESDVRIAKALDKIYMEHGGGGNGYESYTAAWYMGLHRTKLDAIEKQGRKGIIITMGDEPLNPILRKYDLNEAVNGNAEADIETNKLYREACEKFDIFHIAVDSPHSSYNWYKERIADTFGKLLGNRYKVSSVDTLALTIGECIAESIDSNGGGKSLLVEAAPVANVNENGEISW